MSPDSSTGTGTVTEDGDVVVITFVRRLAHPPSAVWAALTDPGQRGSWFGDTTIDGREGGTIEMLPDDPPAPDHLKKMTGRITVWDPPHVLEHEWNQAIVESSVVRYELVADEGTGTVLTFTHRGLSRRNADGFLPGTHAYLDRLAAHLAGETVPAWPERYAELAPRYS
jgi:uncharacterized protein YndB with AHSA1/START domain